MAVSETYLRPQTVEQAIDMLADPSAIALAGGTHLLPTSVAPGGPLVDLQELDIDGVENSEDTLAIGAMVRLDEVALHKDLPDLVRDAASAEMPSTLRTLATVGGTIGARQGTSGLLAALLAHHAEVEFATGAPRPLTSVVAEGPPPGDLIVGVRIDPTGQTTSHAVARTPRDTPIVAVYGRSHRNGVTLVCTGLGPYPIIVTPESIRTLEPEGDFRGSARYRSHLATVLVKRTTATLTSS